MKKASYQDAPTTVILCRDLRLLVEQALADVLDDGAHLRIVFDVLGDLVAAMQHGAVGAPAEGIADLRQRGAT